MSDTPRTDAMLQPVDGRDVATGEPISVVHADDCRTLERELAAVTAERDALRRMADRMCGDHSVPGDCYSTGPLTGGAEDSLCPSCQYLTFRAALRGKEGA